MNKPRLSNSTVPDPADHELDPLLSGPFADAWAVPAPPSTAPVRTRLLARAAASQQAQAGMVTVRRRRMVSQSLGQGLAVRSAYLAPAPATLRAGEPLRVRLIELRAGAELGPEHLGGEAELASRHREWLVLSGRVTQGLLALSTRDYLVILQGHATPRWRADSDTQLFLRESSVAAQPGDSPSVVLDADADWPEYAPGIRRRVLWQRDGQAAMLYHTDAGAKVPHHQHGHDEECLMVEGELFLDDVLLQAGDYQLAPAGTGHHLTETDTGVVLYAHGDLDLRFVN